MGWETNEKHGAESVECQPPRGTIDQLTGAIYRHGVVVFIVFLYTPI